VVRVKETALRLLLDGDKDELKRLSAELRFRPDSYWRADSYQIYKQTDGERGWDGYLYPLKIKNDKGECLRGHLEALEHKADIAGVELDLSGLLPRPFAGIMPDDLPDDLVQASFELDENQRACVAEWLRRCIGVNRVTVSGGKTVCFAAVASFIKRSYPDARFLYFTQSERLVK